MFIIIIIIFFSENTEHKQSQPNQCSTFGGLPEKQHSLTGRLPKQIIQWKQYKKIDSVRTTEVVQLQYSATPRLNI